MGLLQGKVVLVTGAGGGIGRCHALACAREGAFVVVNDLGGSRDGTGKGSSMADQVVAEIKAGGGDAVANYDSVTDYEGCDRMVRAAIDRWGRLDVVVNNAGILRDKTFAKMSPEEWDLVVAVHLTGARNVVRASLDALKAQGGAIINTTSYSGMIGNFGQANYAAAKAGIYGFTRVLALELKKSGVTANCVAPVAKTRMTEEIAMVEEDWKPEQISPIVVYLASDLAKGVTGRVFGVQGQRIHVYEVKTNEGVEKPGAELWTAEEIHAKFADITGFETAAAPKAAGGEDVVTKVFSFFPQGFKPGGVAGWKANIQWDVSGGTSQTVLVDGDSCKVEQGLQGTPTCTVKIKADVLVALFKGELDAQKVFMTGKATADNMGDLMKLAMAFDFKKVAAAYLGAEKGAPVAESKPEPVKPQPSQPTEKVWPIGKRYNGGHWLADAKEFQAYARACNDENPAYFGDDAVAPPMYHVRPLIGLMFKMAGDPELDLDIVRLVHGEHAMRFHRPLRHGDVLQLRGQLADVKVKSSGTVLDFSVWGFVDGETAFEGTTSYFIRAKVRSDEKKKEEAAPAELPPPTLSVTQPVSDDQALRYAKASGDENPIHVDPNAAKAAGLPACILHGLCTMAFAQRDLVGKLGGGDPSRLKSLAVRWAKPVFPGQTLTLKVWDQGGGKLAFETENDKGQVVVTQGRAEIAS